MHATSSFSSNFCCSPLNANQPPFFQKFASLKNSQLHEVLNHLDEVPLSAEDNNWINNNCSNIHELFSNQKITLDELVINAGVKNSFALLVLCYRSAFRSAQHKIFPWGKIADSFGTLLEELSIQYNRKRPFSYLDAKFCKKDVNPAFLKKLEGGAEPKQWIYLGTICKVALGALLLVGAAFAYSSMQGSYPNKTCSITVKQVVEGFENSCKNIGKESYGPLFHSSEVVFDSQDACCYLYVKDSEEITAGDAINKIYSGTIQTEGSPKSLRYVEGYSTASKPLLFQLKESSKEEKYTPYIQGLRGTFAKSLGDDSYIKSYQCLRSNGDLPNEMRVRSNLQSAPTDCTKDTCFNLKMYHRRLEDYQGRKPSPTL